MCTRLSSIVCLLATLAGACVRASDEHADVPQEASQSNPPAAATTKDSATDPDWPQIHGPTRDGWSRASPTGPHAIDPAREPARLFRQEIGAGFAGPVVADGTLVVFHRVGDEETIEALDPRTAKRRWKSSYPTDYRDAFGFDEGPRATPAIAAARVFTFGAAGMLSAHDLASGDRLWQVDTRSRFKPPESYFGAAASPLVVDDNVIVHVGGAMRRTVEGVERGTGLVAFRAATGDLVWSGSLDRVSYSSPILAELEGRPRLLAFARGGLEVIDPHTGDVLLSKPWRARIEASVNAATPLVSSDRIFISTSYQVGALVLRARDGALHEMWSGEGHLTNHYATSVIAGEAVFGYHGRQEAGPSLRAVDLESGKLHWERTGFGAGTLLAARIATKDSAAKAPSDAANDRNDPNDAAQKPSAETVFLALLESGELVVVNARTDSYEEIARHALLSGVVRAYPALARGVLYVRNEHELCAFDLRAAR